MSEKNILYDRDGDEWHKATLSEQLLAIYRHCCTGPCGQSSAVFEQRLRMGKALRDAARLLKDCDE